MRRGQVSIEALLVLGLFFALFGTFLSSANSLKTGSEEFNAKASSISDSKQCALLVDSLYSNSGGKPKTQIQNCTPKKSHEIQVKGNETEKTAFTIADTTRLVAGSGQSTLEVITPEHYR